MIEGYKMVKNIIFKSTIIFSIAISSVYAQEADPVEVARQAKLAAEKAAADAEAATGAALEKAAADAAQEAREKVIADRKAEEARKLAEKEAAEAAEIDAAAEAAALEARRKLAAELGLELEEVPDSSINAEMDANPIALEEAEPKTTSSNGYNFGLSSAAGFVKSTAFSDIPFGGTVVIGTPFGFSAGPLDLTLSIGFGGYTGSYTEDDVLEDFNPIFAGIGANGILSNLVFSETHLGIVGKGLGIRQFAGITLERIMKKGLNLPFNILVGGEGFISTDIQGDKWPAYWGGVGVRLDLSL